MSSHNFLFKSSEIQVNRRLFNIYYVFERYPKLRSSLKAFIFCTLSKNIYQYILPCLWQRESITHQINKQQIHTLIYTDTLFEYIYMLIAGNDLFAYVYVWCCFFFLSFRLLFLTRYCWLPYLFLQFFLISNVWMALIKPKKKKKDFQCKYQNLFFYFFLLLFVVVVIGQTLNMNKVYRNKMQK